MMGIFGSGWRHEAPGDTESHFPDAASWQVEHERRRAVECAALIL